MSANGKLHLYDTHSHQKTHDLTQEGLDVFFPEGIGWTEVLDCRITPYDKKSLEDNCNYAHHQRKSYILVTADRIERSAPPTKESEALDS